jgi:hypothetical protein
MLGTLMRFLPRSPHEFHTIFPPKILNKIGPDPAGKIPAQYLAYSDKILAQELNLKYVSDRILKHI